mmetsp:Transcript_9534/g.19316  ORF Transcript_9534/g.19316 Transcript_9534/m.19316 type:complete len:346 (+) Transcript_9534:50-1087(+)
MSVSIVAQRFRQCKLLLDETDWVTVGSTSSPTNVNSCGLLAYISFASSATRPDVEQAAATLLNLPILTSGLWGDGESRTVSISSTLMAKTTKDPAENDAKNPDRKPESDGLKCSIAIVPQANLISKVKQQGKSIQYHGQSDKETGRELYEYFCECIRSKLLEMQCEIRSEELPEWYTRRRDYFSELDLEQKRQRQKHSKTDDNKQPFPTPDIPPQDIFRDGSKYSSWDENGFPMKDANGEELSKAATKKLKKIYDAHCKRHDTWKEQNKNNDDDSKSTNGDQNKDKTTGETGDNLAVKPPQPPPPMQWEGSLDPEFCHVVAGSFGKRQGLEFVSDMGPFVHSFRV